MGSEAKCRARRGNDRCPSSVTAADDGVLGAAHLESDELRFRADEGGTTRARIPLRDVTRVEVEGGTLHVFAAGASLHLDLGERVALRWAETIRSPKGTLEKLGVKEGADVLVAGALDAELRAALEGRAKTLRAASPALVFLAVGGLRDLSRVATLRKKLDDDGALWIVYPKGNAGVREADVRAAGRAEGLKDVKVARVSETHTALKFVVPLAARTAARGPRAKQKE
jgi:hypothetical protein